MVNGIPKGDFLCTKRIDVSKTRLVLADVIVNTVYGFVGYEHV